MRNVDKKFWIFFLMDIEKFSKKVPKIFFQNMFHFWWNKWPYNFFWKIPTKILNFFFLRDIEKFSKKSSKFFSKIYSIFDKTNDHINFFEKYWQNHASVLISLYCGFVVNITVYHIRDTAFTNDIVLHCTISPKYNIA